jgi:hypothetical protein
MALREAIQFSIDNQYLGPHEGLEESIKEALFEKARVKQIYDFYLEKSGNEIFGSFEALYKEITECPN